MIPAIVLFVAAVLFRIVIAFAGGEGWAMNFAPVAAIALCGPSLFPRRLALGLPLAILLVSDLILNWHYGAAFVTGEMFVRYIALFAVALLGLRIAAKPRVGNYALGSVAGSLGFYLLTNTASWLTAPEYAKTAAGWLQALTIGIPSYPPTWTFFRSSLAGDLMFTMLFIACLALGGKLARSPEAKLAHA